MSKHECIIVWAGPAGIWVAIKLQELWINTIILEGNTIGSSFLKWGDHTHFISPSFPSNAFWQTDLNSIDYASSPWFMFQKEHLNWKEYAQYLQKMVQTHNIEVKENQKVSEVLKTESHFTIKTQGWGEFECDYLISATWEFSFPSSWDIVWSEHALHSSQMWEYTADNKITNTVPIIWWYESAVDSAYALYRKWKKVQVFCPDESQQWWTSDPSKTLSPYSVQRLQEMKEKWAISLTPNYITHIKKDSWIYTLVWKNGNEYPFQEKPILATGFASWLDYLRKYVSYRSDWKPELNSVDELQKTDNIFVVGPEVRQGKAIFCFIFKFRLRFGVIALEIAKRLWKSIDVESTKNTWEKQWFFLEKLENCWDECIC